MPTSKNGFHILNLHHKIYIFKKVPFFNDNLLEKFQNQCMFCIAGVGNYAEIGDHQYFNTLQYIDYVTLYTA